MNKFTNTLKLVESVLTMKNIDWILTRFTEHANDLDVLVKSRDYENVISVLVDNGFIASSHDQALGGRIKNMQKNLTKKGFTKIDLHRDFTWRKNRYLDLDFVWKAKQKNRLPKEVDAFLILINIIFEKTYLKHEDFLFLKQNFADNQRFEQQAKKYGWHTTYTNFLNWFANQKELSETTFLPVGLVFRSFTQKFDFVSFCYYLFFRIRFLFSKTLPYD